LRHSTRNSPNVVEVVDLKPEYGLDICLRFLYITNKLYNQMVKHKK